MKNKILITLVVPCLLENYEIFIPVNERISKIKMLLINAISDLTDDTFDKEKNYNLIDPDTGEIYQNNQIIRDTDIKNSKTIILF